MYSKTVTVGRLTRDPEERTVNDKKLASFSIAWDHPFKRDNTQYTNVTVWGREAEIVISHCKKGRLVLVEGTQTTRSWDKTVGGETVRMYATELEADRVRFLDSPKKDGSNASSGQSTWNNGAFGRTDEVSDSNDFALDGDDLPF